MKKKILFSLMLIFACFCLVLTGCNTSHDETEELSSELQATFEGFECVSNSTYSIKTSNETEIIDFSDIVSVSSGLKWKLSTDIYGNDTLPSKIGTLTIGDNTYYILVSDDEDHVKMYTLNIRRRPIHNVIFNTLGGSYISSQNIEEDSCISAISEPTKTGYTFVSWNRDLTLPITTSVEITAEWHANNYTITYHYDGKTNVQEVVYDSQVTLKDSTTFARDYYNLTGWNTKVDKTGTNYNLLQTITQYNYSENIDLYAVWTPIEYTITYELCGGTNNANNPITYNVESPTINLADPTRRGYRFTGWSNEGVITTYSHGELIFVASWEVITYTITYHLNDYEDDCMNNPNNITIYTIEDEDFFLLDPLRGEYYHFLGWFTDEMFTNKITIIHSNECNNSNLYAKWKSVFDVTDKTIVGFDNTLTKIVIPTHIKDSCCNTNIESIGQSAFENCDNIIELNISSGIISLGYHAFYGCSVLTSLIIPNSVTTIGYGAFFDCPQLTYNVYDNANYLGNNDNPYLILVNALYINILSCNINSNTKFILDCAFIYCTKITQINIPDVISIGESAFEICNNLTTVFYIGTCDKWNDILIGSNNGWLTLATKYFYSEIQPTGEGNYWHYVDGEVVLWNIK